MYFRVNEFEVGVDSIFSCNKKQKVYNVSIISWLATMAGCFCNNFNVNVFVFVREIKDSLSEKLLTGMLRMLSGYISILK